MTNYYRSSTTKGKKGWQTPSGGKEVSLLWWTWY